MKKTGNNITEAPKNRLAFIDNLRSLVVMLVITVHAGVTYSGFGGWYYIEGSPEKLNIPETVFFGFFLSFMQAWTMGILFFISAYLAVKSLSKRGTKSFIKERLFRLGRPLLIYMFLISPLIYFFLLNGQVENNIWKSYLYFLFNLSWLTGPLWYVQILLIFCFLYIITRKIFPKRKAVNRITPKNIVFIILSTGITAFLIRLVFPIGTSFSNLQLCYFASYIALLILGVITAENDLLEHITKRENIIWLKLSLIIGTPIWCLIMIFGGALKGEMYINGGFRWQSFSFALWEAFTAIGFSIGLTALFREKINIYNKFTRLLAENAFGIYVFHSPILISISLMLRQWAVSAGIKYFSVTIIACTACLLFSIIIRKIRPIGLIFK
jgi:surface polysaccharide O-acyltransferase-like enzyme